MSVATISPRRSPVAHLPRSIHLRTRGYSHGAITRLISPGDIGELVKSFVFLDYFDADPQNAPKFGFHPHSGIATLTLVLSGKVFYRETTDREGIIEPGGVEWIRRRNSCLRRRQRTDRIHCAGGHRLRVGFGSEAPLRARDGVLFRTHERRCAPQFMSSAFNPLWRRNGDNHGGPWQSHGAVETTSRRRAVQARQFFHPGASARMPSTSASTSDDLSIARKARSLSDGSRM